MGQIAAVHLRIFAKPEDDAAEVRKALLKLVPFSIEEKKLAIKEEPITTPGRTVVVLRLDVAKRALANAAMQHLVSLLEPSDREKLVQQADSRTDDAGFFFIRLDKQKWLQGIAELTDSGDCFHISLEIATYPKRRDSVIGFVTKLFMPEQDG
jgi:RNA binding exosome subunit